MQNVTDFLESPSTPRRNSTDAPTVADSSPPSGSGTTITLAPSPVHPSAQGLVIPAFAPRPPARDPLGRIYSSVMEPEEARETEKRVLELLDQFDE
jgi:hypothetical protein